MHVATYLYDPSLVCCKALRSNKVEVEATVVKSKLVFLCY